MSHRRGDRMIPKKQAKYKQLLSKTTMMSLRNLARKGSDAELEDFIRQVSVNYIAARLNADVVDDEKCLVVDDKTDYECEITCPECGEKVRISLDLKGLLE